MATQTQAISETASCSGWTTPQSFAFQHPNFRSKACLNCFPYPDQAKEILEAALFAAGHPLTYARLAQVFEISPEEVRNMVSEYAEEYNSGKVARGLCC